MFFRWKVIQMFGVMMIATGLSVFIPSIFNRQNSAYFSPVLFLSWLILSFWGFQFQQGLSRPSIQLTTIAWQKNYSKDPANELCTALQPMGWHYAPNERCTLFGEREFNPITKSIPANIESSILKPEGVNDSNVQSIVAIYHLTKADGDHTVKLTVNDTVLKTHVEIETGTAKQMMVQFFLAKPLIGSSIDTVTLEVDVPIHIATNNVDDGALSHWYGKP
jgi:hypothetical protein